MTTKQTILYTLGFSGKLVGSMTADLTPEQLHHRATPEANCAAWLLGHLVLVERRALKLLGADLPALPDGFDARFSREEDAPKAADFGDVAMLPSLFDEHRQKLLAAVEQVDESTLDKPLDNPSPRFTTVGEMLAFFPIHVAMHAGQISTIRRSLAMPPLF